MTSRTALLLPLALLAAALPGSTSLCTRTTTTWLSGTFQQDVAAGQQDQTDTYTYGEAAESRRLDVTFLPEPLYPQGDGIGTQWVALLANAGGSVNLGAAGRGALGVVFEPDVPGATAHIAVTGHYGGPLATAQDGLPYEPYQVRIIETVPC